MITLPAGTVTFLFTDIEGSTRLWEECPEEMKTTLARHDAILTQAIDANGGHIVKTTGDGTHAVFDTAAAGLATALAAQQALSVETWDEIKPHAIRVRMGLHTGEAEFRAGDYYGSALNRAARLMSVGHGGQILLSNVTAELVREDLPVNSTLRDLGEHHLKDLSRPEHIYQLAHPSLLSEFPPLNTFDTIPNNLPIQLTSFIGREKEIADIKGLLQTARLITLTGSGGTGKTRLVQEVGAMELPNYPSGVWLIELAQLTDPSQIILAVAQVFGFQEMPGIPLATLIGNYLHDKKALLILDNCEHLIAACAHLANELLQHCTQIRVLTSSREALGIAGEMAYSVPSLSEYEAVHLFLERAKGANPKFHLTESNAPAIARICQRLDGIPLAIELAAARSKLLSPEQIAARLDDRFRLLIGGSRTALPRQQTLRALIDWSYDFLTEQEKRLLRSTSVFVGGWTLDAIESVAEAPDTLEYLEQLVNKSLVVTEASGDEMRYSLLETIRQYAREKLFDAGLEEAVRVRNRHLAFYLNLSEFHEPRLEGPDMIDSLDALEEEQDNFRVALEWAMESNPLAALRIAAALASLWGRRGSPAEGLDRIKNALARAETQFLPENEVWQPFLTAKAKALAGEAALTFQLGDNRAAAEAVEAGLALARQLNDTKILVYTLSLGSTIYGFLSKPEVSHAFIEEVAPLAQKHGYIFAQAMAKVSEIFRAVMNNEVVTPEQIDEITRISRFSGNPWVLGLAISNAGRAASSTGSLAQAQGYFEEALELFKKMRDEGMYNSTRSEIGHVLRKQGRYAEAEEVYRKTIQSFKERSQWAAAAHELECFALIAVAQGHGERAAKLFGAAEALREQIGSMMLFNERREYEGAVTALEAQLGPAEMQKAWADGRAIELDQAIAIAIA